MSVELFIEQADLTVSQPRLSLCVCVLTSVNFQVSLLSPCSPNILKSDECVKQISVCSDLLHVMCLRVVIKGAGKVMEDG